MALRCGNQALVLFALVNAYLWLLLVVTMFSFVIISHVIGRELGVSHQSGRSSVKWY